MADETTDAAQAPAGAVDETGSIGGTAAARRGEAEPSHGETTRPNPRKVREGFVTSAAMEKTAVVRITERVRHRLYNKTVQRSTRLYVHDEQNECRQGDKVKVQETRPISKLKRWRVIEVLERAR